MTHEVPLNLIQSSGDPAFRYRMMREVVETVEARGTLFMPLLNLVSTFIDGLASGPPGKTKTAYISFLQQHFPDLCRELGAEVFYQNFRNAAVHEFNLKNGFGIARDSDMVGAYASTFTVAETKQELTVLNIDRLVRDFLAVIRSLEDSSR